MTLKPATGLPKRNSSATMQQLQDCPVIGLDVDFPTRLWVLKHTPSGRYGCYCFDSVHGLAVFSEEDGATLFSEWIDLNGTEPLEVSFDEAREIAQGRPLPVVSIMLLDNPEQPEIHYVR